MLTTERDRAAGSVARRRPASGSLVQAPGGMAARMVALQRLAGNRAVAGLALQRACGCGCAGSCGSSKGSEEREGLDEAQQGTSGRTLQRLTSEEKLVDLKSPELSVDDRLQKAFDNAPVLAPGAPSGDTVKRYQQGLMDAGFAMPKSTTPGGPDGRWGGETTKATQDFQKKHGLNPDGTAGRKTLGALDEMYVAEGAQPAKKVPPGLQIIGKRRADKSGSRVFFERGSAVVEADEAATIAALATPVDRKLKVTGLRSEDEPVSLANDRVNAVTAALAAAKHSGPKLADPKPDASGGQIDYRRVRAVEITADGATPKVPDCKAGEDVPCGPDPSPFSTGHRRAQEILTEVIGRLATPDAATLALVKKVFGTPSVAGTVRKNLGKIEKHMSEMPQPAHHRCHNDCDPVCAGAEAYNEGIDAGARMTLCPTFQATTDVDQRAGLLIHEGSHGTGGLNKRNGTDDKAYHFQRMINFLSTADALANADSYTIFVRNLLVPDSVSMGPSKPDTFADLTDDESTAVERAIAFAEKWYDGDENEASAAYTGAREAKAKSSWAGSAGEPAMKAIAKRLALTAPPAVPTDSDIHDLAGVNDRFHRLFRSLGGPVAVSKAPVGEDRFDVVKRTFAVTPGFFVLSKRRQLDLVIAKMVEGDPDIRPEHEAPFVALADDLRQLNGVAGP